MEPTELRVQSYRSLDDTGWVELDDLTCLVGRNESGKTAFMRAVEKLNPAYGDDGYVPYAEYPREEWAEYSDQHEENPEVVASGRFRLDDDDIDAVEEAYIEGLVADREVTVHRDYANDRHWEIELAEAVCLDYLRDTHEFSDGVDAELESAETVTGLSKEASRAVESKCSGEPVSTLEREVGADLLTDRLPGFRFIGEYSVMNGTIDINGLLDRRKHNELSPGDRVFLSLLTIAGLDLGSLRDVEDWRQTITELEAASATVSNEAMDYWSQSGDISIRIRRAGTEEKPVLDVRVENRDQSVTVEFEQRSHGFRRFFSTFCQLSELEQSGEELVVLLDEPGLNLHARAKQEFLEFLKTDLATNHPTVYTAHSPFMIDKDSIHRVRMVLGEPPGGTNIVGDVSLADEYTRFPLRNVFEFDLMDTLLVYPQTLLVEQKADHVFLYVLSQMLRDAGKDGLDSRWTVIPVEHGDNVGTFISLFGEDRLDVAALLNEMPEWKKPARGRDETESPLAEIPVRLASEYSASDRGTIEDALSVELYLNLVNGSYATAIRQSETAPDRLTVAELDGSGPVVEQVEQYFQSQDINGGVFDRDRPALYFQRNRVKLSEELDKETRRNATRLFNDLNNILESFEGVQIREGSFLGSLFG